MILKHCSNKECYTYIFKNNNNSTRKKVWNCVNTMATDNHRMEYFHSLFMGNSVITRS